MCVVSKLLLMGRCALCALRSEVVVVFACLATILCRGECVCVCGLWVVLYVVDLCCFLMIPDRFMQGELGGCRILEVNGKCSKAYGIIWIVFCRFMVAKKG